MTETIHTLISACEWAPSSFLVLSDNVFVPLIYYSHLGATIPAILIGIFIFANSSRELSSKLLLLTLISFAGWVFSDLVLWATEYPSLTMFFWTLEIILEPLVYFFAFYFFYTFTFGKDLSFKQKILFITPLIPTFVLAPTSFGLLGYDLSNCDRAASEGILATYGYAIELLYVIAILTYSVKAITAKKIVGVVGKTFFLTVGILAFLLSFSLGNITEVFTENWYIGQYGLFGAPIFAAFLAFLIVKYRAFNLKLIGAQVLVAALWFLLFAILFIRTVEITRIVVSITLLFVLVLGGVLIRGVQREIEQREKIEKLAHELERSNKQQVILIHFITHQIKGFVAKSRNIFSLLLDGDYGQLPESMKPLVEEGFRSDTKGANTIQEILSAANIKSGKVTYSKAEFDVKALAEEIAGDLKPLAENKGLALELSFGTEPLMIHGDRIQLLQAIKNLIDNSIKYTPSGTVAVSLTKADKLVRFTVKDTGVGITKEDMAKLFTEGGHGTNSQKINVDSTGFGLYIVKNIIEAHGGRVFAESEGEGKGSTFTIELPV